MRNTTSPSDALAALSGRAALVIGPSGVLTIGTTTTRHDPGDPTSLLTAYLGLVRKLRGQRRAVSVVLRRDDITALAEVLGTSAADIVERLGALMGATRSQRIAMATMFAAGALVIGLGASGAVSSNSAGAAATVPGIVGPNVPPSAASAERPAPADFAPLVALADEAVAGNATDGPVAGVVTGTVRSTGSSDGRGVSLG